MRFFLGKERHPKRNLSATFNFIPKTYKWTRGDAECRLYFLFCTVSRALPLNIPAINLPNDAQFDLNGETIN